MILLGAELVHQASFGKNHIRVPKDFVLWNIALQAAALGQTHRKHVHRLADVGVLNQAVAGKTADAVQDFAGLEVAFGGSDYVADGRTERGNGGVMEKNSA